MSYPTGFETGALTSQVNSLILFTENTRELAEFRDKIFQQSGSDIAPWIEFCKKCVSQYNIECMSDKPLQLSASQVNDFVNLYKGNYYDDWKYENINNDVASEPVLEVLQKCVVDGMIVRLPPKQLERSLYNEVKDKLEKIGGKWKGGKIQGFMFTNDPAELLVQVANGANRNLKKEFQFFETPNHIADQVIELAEIKENMMVFEPEIGRAALIEAMWRAGINNLVWACEIQEENRKYVEDLSDDIRIIGEDFLQLDGEYHNEFDVIIANPPFSNNQDIDHIRKMYDYVKPGGRIVSVASKGWTFSSKNKQTAFRAWLEELEADIIELESGEFKESGTMVSSVIVVINKPKS